VRITAADEDDLDELQELDDEDEKAESQDEELLLEKDQLEELNEELEQLELKDELEDEVRTISISISNTASLSSAGSLRVTSNSRFASCAAVLLIL
jgi:hypothetical protein